MGQGHSRECPIRYSGGMNYPQPQAIGSNTAFSNVPVQPDPQPEVAQAIDRLDGASNRLDNAICAMRQKLEPVMRPSTPSPAMNQAGAPSPIVCGLTVALDSRTRTIDALADSIEEILQRLAV